MTPQPAGYASVTKTEALHRERAGLYTPDQRVASTNVALAATDSAPEEPPERLAPTEVPERLVPDDIPESPPGPSSPPDPGPPQRT